MNGRLANAWQSLLTGAGLPPAWAWLTMPARVSWVVVRRLDRDRAFVRAAGMAYATLIALVPLLLLVFGVLEATGVLDNDREAVESLIFGSFLGDIPEVREFLLPGLQGVDLRAMGIIGIGGLFVVAVRLYIQVENAYNDFFGVENTRSWTLRLLLFYAASTAVPVMIVAVFLRTWQFSEVLGVWGTTRLLTSAIVYILLLAALKAFPCTGVRWRPALIGAAVSLGAFELASLGFRTYLMLFVGDDPVTLIYGSLGALPVFLLWLYLAWLTILLGVATAAVSQDPRASFESEWAVLIDEHRRDTLPGSDTALLVASQIAAAFEAGRGATTREDLTSTLAVRAVELSPALRAMELSGVVLAVGTESWTLARPPEQIEVATIVAGWRQHASPHITEHPVLQAIRAEMDMGLRGNLAEAVARWHPNEEHAAPRDGRLEGRSRGERPPEQPGTSAGSSDAGP